jgi:hypothetical protein
MPRKIVSLLTPEEKRAAGHALSLGELSQLSGISRATIYRYTKLPGFPVRQHRIFYHHFEAWFARGDNGAEPRKRAEAKPSRHTSTQATPTTYNARTTRILAEI